MPTAGEARSSRSLPWPRLAASKLRSWPSHDLGALTHEQHGCIRGLAVTFLLTGCAQCKDEDDDVDR